MTHVTIPNRPLPGQNRDINAILADFDAITTVINGQLSNDNIENEGISNAKLSSGNFITSLENGALVNSSGHKLELKYFLSAPTCGNSISLFSYTEAGITFATACTFAWIAGLVNFTDAEHKTPTSDPITFAADPEGKSVKVSFQNGVAAFRYPQVRLLALGY